MGEWVVAPTTRWLHQPPHGDRGVARCVGNFFTWGLPVTESAQLHPACHTPCTRRKTGGERADLGVHRERGCGRFFERANPVDPPPSGRLRRPPQRLVMTSSSSYSTDQLVELSTVAASVTAAVLVLSTWRTTGLTVLFSYHPIFMSIGFLVMFTRGIQIGWRARDTDGTARVGALTNHMTTQVAGVACASVGFAVIYLNKYINGKDHFTSLHGKLGLLTMLLTSAVAALGYCGFKKHSPLPAHLHSSAKFFHRGLGASTWVLSLVTIVVVLPHKAVVTGLLARAAQAGVMGVGVLTLMWLRERGSGSKGGGSIVDFTLVPRERSY